MDTKMTIRNNHTPLDWVVIRTCTMKTNENRQARMRKTPINSPYRLMPCLNVLTSLPKRVINARMNTPESNDIVRQGKPKQYLCPFNHEGKSPQSDLSIMEQISPKNATAMSLRHLSSFALIQKAHGSMKAMDDHLKAYFHCRPHVVGKSSVPLYAMMATYPMNAQINGKIIVDLSHGQKSFTLTKAKMSNVTSAISERVVLSQALKQKRYKAPRPRFSRRDGDELNLMNALITPVSTRGNENSLL
ncbi:hypothetical protein [Dissulfuribacter thermophilus]|nr:hypothetical protein [Dissulfuribacter thermophilus]